jgi:hypothetical protein
MTVLYGLTTCTFACTLHRAPLDDSCLHCQFSSKSVNYGTENWLATWCCHHTKAISMFLMHRTLTAVCDMPYFWSMWNSSCTGDCLLRIREPGPCGDLESLRHSGKVVQILIFFLRDVTTYLPQDARGDEEHLRISWLPVDDMISHWMRCTGRC